MDNKHLIIGLTASHKLAEKIAKKLNTRVAKATIKHFADGETIVTMDETVRAKHVYFVQATSKPVNENLMELLIAIDSARRASAKSITVICPYFGYARQDRKTNAREPITCKLASKLIERAGADRITIVDLHSEQAQGFFEVPADTVTASYQIMKEIIKDYGVKNTIVVSPDYGSVKRARKLSHRLGLPMAILDKRRPEPNKAEICSVLGEVRGKNCIIIDDMIDTGGTLLAACAILKKKGAKNIIAGATHGLFSNNGEARFNDAAKKKIFSRLYVSNSIDNVYDLKIKNLKIVDISDLLSKIVNVYVSDGKHTITELYAATKIRREK